LINPGALLINFGALLLNFGTLFDIFGAFLQFYGVFNSRIAFYTRFNWFWGSLLTIFGGISLNSGALFDNFSYFSRSSALTVDSGATFWTFLERFGHFSRSSWFWGFLQF